MLLPPTTDVFLSACGLAAAAWADRPRAMNGCVAALGSATVAMLLAGSMAAQAATTIVLNAVADTSIYSEGDAQSDGAGPYIWVGQTHVGNNRRALVRFDLSAVPPGSVIAGARLRIAMSKSISTPAVVEIRRLTSSWGEGTSNGRAGGAGFAASGNDATWGFRFFGARVPWAVPGGDYVAGAPSASTQVEFSGATWTWSGAGLVSDAQLWVDSPADNFGWIVIGQESMRSAMRFESRNGFVGPVLELDIVPGSANVPIPMAWLLVGGCVLLGVMLKRSR